MNDTNKMELNFGLSPVERCPLCRCERNVERLQVEMPAGGAARFVSCPECRLVYLDPAPGRAALDDFYNSLYLTPEYRKLERFSVPDPVQELGATMNYMELVMNDIEEYRESPGRLLDVGCAYGGLLLEAVSRGWDAEGIEPFAHAAEFCKTALGLNVRHGSVFDADLPAESFDAVVLTETLEHLDRPVQAMMRITAAAKPDAVIYITTPNPNSPAAVLGKSAWIGWKPPTHVCLFDFFSIRTLFERTGWTPLKLKSHGIYPGQLIAVARKHKRA